MLQMQNNDNDNDCEMTMDEIKEEQDNELNKYNCNKDIIFNKNYIFLYKFMNFIINFSGILLILITNYAVTICILKNNIKTKYVI